MKKVILVCDGTHFSESGFQFASRLNDLRPILLTGVFLPQAELINTADYQFAGTTSIISSVEVEQELKPKNVDHFERLCLKNGIEFRVHIDENDFADSELEQESKFADLLIIDSESYYKNAGTDLPNDYLKQVLHEIACPVLVVPEIFDFPESIILTYDGSDNSIYAIKQFAYLFNEFTQKETLLVYADEHPEKDFPDKILIEELVTRHFSDLTLVKLDLKPRKYFSTWLLERKSAILVCGSYGRAGISELFNKSFIEEVIADHQVPVFIAHQ